MDMSAGGRSALLVLAELALFWSAMAVHLLRLLSPTRLPDADRPADAGHAVMGAGMTVMVFPGVSVAALRILALGYAMLAMVFLVRATRSRSRPLHRGQDAAIGAGQASMAYMFAAPAHPPTWLPVAVAGVLAVCAVVHGRRLIDTRHWTGGTIGVPRVLVTLPHVGALVMTLAMAGMVAAVSFSGS
jgi:hypothetical protein